MPSSFLAVLVSLAGVFLVVIFDQSYWWREKADYSFGWLVPVFVAYVFMTRWNDLKQQFSSAAPNPVAPRWYWVGFLMLALAASLVVFGLGSVYRAAAGPSNGGTMTLTVGAIGVGIAGVSLGAYLYSRTLSGAWRVVSVLIFPLLIWLISAPLLTLVEHTLSTLLRAKITVVVFGFYDLLGFPIEQVGNILILPTGQVGVAEACSGIRSLTGCLFAGSFLAATQVEKQHQKAILIAASLVLAVLANLLRSLFLTGWSIAYGSTAIEGTVHDATGYAVLGLTVCGLLLLLPLFRTEEIRPVAAQV